MSQPKPEATKPRCQKCGAVLVPPTDPKELGACPKCGAPFMPPLPT